VNRKATGTSDALYDLILVLQQALADCVRYQHFADDAREGGDGELAAWFDQLGRSDEQIAEHAKHLLACRLGVPGRGTAPVERLRGT
jgi:hypothetical protein